MNLYPAELISYTSSSQMLQIQLQMVQRGAAVLATNNENAEHTKND
jgi:E3 ubiquitin-protein ligase synoviolin